MKHFFIGVLVGLWGLCAGFAVLPFGNPARAQTFPAAQTARHPNVETQKFSLHDGARGRDVSMRVYLPKAEGRFPVIIFSHGFGGDLDGFENTGRIWAQAGYVVIHPTHGDSLRYGTLSAATRAMVIKYLRTRARGGADEDLQREFVQVLDDPALVRDRLADIRLILDAVGSASGLPADIAAHLDSGRIGMAGHSFGAYTTLILAGAQLSGDAAGAAADLSPRFKAFMAISGQGTGRMNLPAGAFAGIDVPLMSITGTKDFGAADETPDWRLEAFRQSRPGDKFALVMKDVTHSGFDVLPSRPGTDPLREAETAFWDAYLQALPPAKDALKAAFSSRPARDAVESLSLR